MSRFPTLQVDLCHSWSFRCWCCHDSREGPLEFAGCIMVHRSQLATHRMIEDMYDIMYATYAMYALYKWYKHIIQLNCHWHFKKMGFPDDRIITAVHNRGQCRGSY